MQEEEYGNIIWMCSKLIFQNLNGEGGGGKGKGEGGRRKRGERGMAKEGGERKEKANI